MSDDEDWFERALKEDAGADQDREGDAENGESDGDDAAVGSSETTIEGTDESDDPPFGPDDADGDLSSEGAPAGDDDPFGEDFASAFENAPDPEGGGMGGSDEAFGGAVDDSGAAGQGEFGGFGGDPGAGGEEFGGGTFDADADIDSDIERIQLGIEGLDEMILGGVPRRSLIAVIGSAGTGKTTFGLQFLYQALVEGNRAVYVTLEETRERILGTADEKGWEFSEYVADDRLAVVDLDPVEMANSLASISSELPELIEEFGADRLVLDSVSLLEMMYDHPSRRRSQVFEFARALKQAGVTTMVTSEASSESAYASRYGIIEYLSDAVFVLQYVRPSDFRETRLAVEIQKIRDADHSRETKPYDITAEGISVYRQANIF